MFLAINAGVLKRSAWPIHLLIYMCIYLLGRCYVVPHDIFCEWRTLYGLYPLSSAYACTACSIIVLCETHVTLCSRDSILPNPATCCKVMNPYKHVHTYGYYIHHMFLNNLYCQIKEKDRFEVKKYTRFKNEPFGYLMFRDNCEHHYTCKFMWF